jgi:hypothetical protein
MPAITAPNQVGVREDLSDLIYLADVKATPFTSMVKKGPGPLDPLLWEYGVKKRGNRKRGGVPDGKDINAFDAQNPRDFIQTRSEVWRRAPMVGFLAQIRSRNGAIAGVTNEFDEAVADQLEELKRDMEKEFFSNQDSTRDDGVNGSHTRALGRFIYDGSATLTINTTDFPLDTSPTTGYAELPIPAGYRTPSNQIFTGSIAAMDETADFAALLDAKWGNTGASSELAGFVTQAIKNRINFYTWYQKEVPGFNASVQVTTGRVSGDTFFGPSVDIYKSEWGTYRLFPVSADFMPTLYTGYFLDMKQIRLRVTQNVVQTELPNQGGGPREMIQSIIGLEAGDPRAHAKIDGTA